MNDLLHAGTLFLVFALALILYGALLVKTGNKDLLPYRAMLSVRGPQDVRHLGKITVIVGTVIGILALLVRALAS